MLIRGARGRKHSKLFPGIDITGQKGLLRFVEIVGFKAQIKTGWFHGLN